MEGAQGFNDCDDGVTRITTAPCVTNCVPSSCVTFDLSNTAGFKLCHSEWLAGGRCEVVVSVQVLVQHVLLSKAFNSHGRVVDLGEVRLLKSYEQMFLHQQ